jgi:hypothetical protein
MSLITFEEIEQARKNAFGSRLLNASARTILQDDTIDVPMSFQFDIFLSHAFADVGITDDHLLGLKALLEGLGYSVYVDWVIDRHLSRETVDAETARWLRKRMINSRCLLFATSQSFQSSKWMPWEIGFKDGHTGSPDALAWCPSCLSCSSRAGRGTKVKSTWACIHIFRKLQ